MAIRFTGIPALLTAQFFSVFADNALLFIGIALLRANASPQWQVPCLEQIFLVGFVVLAPFAGPLAERMPKGKLLFFSNGLKFVGASFMWAGIHPLLSYLVVGVGAVLYATAKRSILVEQVPADKLVKMNGLLEGSSIVAILVGAVAGGYLADHSLSLGWKVLAALYFLSAVANCFIPNTLPRDVGAPVGRLRMLSNFVVVLRKMRGDRQIALALYASSLVWASAIAIRLMAVVWASTVLGRSDLATPALLNGVVAIGIAVGAIFSARLVKLRHLSQVLALAACVGVILMIFSVANNLLGAKVLMFVLGTMVGAVLIPLNSIVQYRGHTLVGAGNAVASQAFMEYGTAVIALGLFALSQKAGMSLFSFNFALGCMMLAGLSALALRGRRVEVIAT